MRDAGDVGLVHDYLLVMRGAERTFAEIAAYWPEAPLYTTLYSETGTEGRFRERQVRTSGLQRLPLTQRNFRRALPLYPRAVEKLPVQDHGLIVSSSSAFALGVRPESGAVHVCYCHTPFRYAWHERERALAEAPRLLRPALRRTLDRIRHWDAEAANRVTAFVANSELTRERIRHAYDRDATVVYPPVDVGRFRIATPEDYFLVVSELVPHKRVDIAVAAARQAGVRLLVVGDGPDRGRLARDAGPTVELLGRVSDVELARLYSRALATVVPAVEEFGIVAVESQAAGRPVITGLGGGRESVIDGHTGLLLDQGSTAEFAEALAGFDPADFSPAAARESAERFAPQGFRERFAAEVARAQESRKRSSTGSPSAS